MIRDILTVLLRRKWLVIAPFVVVFLLPTLYALSTSKQYISESMIAVEPNRVIGPVVDEEENPNKLEQPIDKTVELARELLVSRAFLLAVANQAGMEAEVAKNADSAVGKLKSNFESFPVGPQRLVLRYRGESPIQAQKVVAAGTELLLAERRAAVEADGASAAEFFATQADSYRSQVAEKQEAVRAFKAAHPEVELSSQAQSILDNLSLARAQLGQVRLKLQEEPSNTALIAREAELLVQIEQMSVPIGATPDVELQLMRHEDELNQSREAYQRGMERVNDAELLVKVQLERVGRDRIVDAPSLPTSASRGKAMTLALLSFIVATAMAAGLVVLAEHLDPSVRREADVAESIGLVVLGSARAGATRSA